MTMNCIKCVRRSFGDNCWIITRPQALWSLDTKTVVSSFFFGSLLWSGVQWKNYNYHQNKIKINKYWQQLCIPKEWRNNNGHYLPYLLSYSLSVLAFLFILIFFFQFLKLFFTKPFLLAVGGRGRTE